MPNKLKFFISIDSSESAQATQAASNLAELPDCFSSFDEAYSFSSFHQNFSERFKDEDRFEVTSSTKTVGFPIKHEKQLQFKETIKKHNPFANWIEENVKSNMTLDSNLGRDVISFESLIHGFETEKNQQRYEYCYVLPLLTDMGDVERAALDYQPFQTKQHKIVKRKVFIQKSLDGSYKVYDEEKSQSVLEGRIQVLSALEQETIAPTSCRGSKLSCVIHPVWMEAEKISSCAH